MHAFDADIALQRAARPAGEGSGSSFTFDGQVRPDYNIGANPNGGYLLALAAQALQQVVPQHPDPLSVTVHYLKPGLPGQACRIEVELLRSGRNVSTLRASLLQDGGPRLVLLAAMGDLGEAAQATIELPPPPLHGPDDCPGRDPAAQGIEMAILNRLEVRLHPDQARPGQAGRAEIGGWARFADGRAPCGIGCLLFADAFPPSVFSLLGMVGWVPSVELTVHLRRRPAPGWVQGRFVTRDLIDGRAIEDGWLWDSQGRLVAQARQLALVRTRLLEGPPQQ